MDKDLVAALPDDNPRLIERLHATAFGDFTAHIRQNERIRREHGPDVFDNLFTIYLRSGSLNYEEFPFLLENLTGKLVIRTVPAHPTRLPPTPGIVVQRSFGDTGVLEFHDFKATHRGASIRGSGRKIPSREEVCWICGYTGRMLNSTATYTKPFRLFVSIHRGQL